MPRIIDSIEILAPVERVYAFCTDCRNMPPLFPKDVRVEIIRHPTPPLSVGDEIALQFQRSGLVYPWESVITRCDPCHTFEDIQVRGPMRQWVSRHSFEPTERGTRVTHHIEYAFHFGALGRLCGVAFLDGTLRRIFRYVHHATKEYIETEGRLDTASKERTG